MVANSSNINKTNNHPLTEHKKTKTYGRGNSGPGLGQEKH